MTTNPPDELAKALALHSRLKDMQAHLETMTPTLVQSTDGRLMMTAAGMPHAMTVEEDYPLSTPKNKLLPLTEDISVINGANAALISDLQSRFDGFSLNNLDGTDGSHLLARSMSVAIQPVHDFQVVWSGARRQWYMGKGTFTDHGINRAIPQAWLSGDSGFIVLPVTVIPGGPYINTSEIMSYTIASVGSLQLAARPVQQPCTLTITATGIYGDDNFTTSYCWTQGSYQLPIAFVRPPSSSRRTPLILQMQTCAINLLDTSWLGSFPGYLT